LGEEFSASRVRRRMRYARRSGNMASPSEGWRGAVVCLAATFFAPV